MNETMIQSQEGFSTRCQKVLQVARELFQGKPDWVTFFRETLGVSGAARNVFPRQQDYVAFEKSREYAEIQNMVLALRNRKIPGSSGNEPTRVITVRLPESLHEALKAEASDHNTSMNKLCISKLLQVLVDNQNKQAAAQQAAAQQAAAQQARTLPQPQLRPQTATPQPPMPGQVPTTAPQSSTHTPPNFRSTFNQNQLPPQQPPRNFGQ